MNNLPFPYLQNVSLSQLSTFAIGGLAKKYIPLATIPDLVKVLNYLWQNSLPFQIFSGGSNIVFPDQGLDEILIHLKDGSLEVRDNLLTADSGVKLTQVINFAIKNGLSGLENLSGIPGSTGGAVVGNAGAYGSSVSDVIQEVNIWDKGRVYWINKKDCYFTYRESIFKKKKRVILKVKLRFKKGNKNNLLSISRQIINKRRVKYKEGLRCPGSFFKNILVTDLFQSVLEKIDSSKIVFGKIPAGILLESVGAKGMKIGEIEIASFHGNLFINNGQGTAADVKKLAEILKKKVYQKFGILLEEEIRYF